MAPKTDCEKYIALTQRHCGVEKLSDSDRTFLEEHLENCPECTLERELFRSAAHNTGIPTVPLDELTKRRFVSNIVNQANEEINSINVREKTRSRKTLWLLGAAAALLTIGVGLGLIIHNELASQSEIPKVAVSPTSQLHATILLTGKSNGNPLILDNALAMGQQVSSGDNPMVLDIYSGIQVFVKPHSTVMVNSINHNQIELALTNGEVVASVRPRKTGPTFSVITSVAKMKVTGTVFSVSHDDDDTQLRVLRGSVEVHDSRGLRCAVMANQAAGLPQWKVRNTTSEELSMLWESTKVLDVVSSNDAVLMDINSQPPGAAVSIDGRRVGQTPLIAKVRSGHRLLTLSLDGYQQVNEQIDAVVGASHERMFVLSEGDSKESVEGTPSEVKSNLAASVSKHTAKSADELLAQAQEYRIKRQWRQAARAYEQLIRKYPASGESSAALVSLGKLELNKLGKARAALSRFNQYLARGGALSQEALYAKTIALKRLGRTDEEKRTLEQFVATYPNAIEVDAAKGRISQLMEK